VLDEADRLLNMDFEAEIDQILRVIPRERRTQLFSATMTSKARPRSPFPRPRRGARRCPVCWSCWPACARGVCTCAWAAPSYVPAHCQPSRVLSAPKITGAVRGVRRKKQGLQRLRLRLRTIVGLLRPCA